MEDTAKCCGITRGRQEAIDQVKAILLNEFAADSGWTTEAAGDDEVIGFPYTERGELNSVRDRADGELNTAFKPLARSAPRGSQVHQKFFDRHATA
jgi:hypothetical protein